MSNAGTAPRMYTPAQIAENYLNIGVNKVRQNPLSAFLLAVMAGMGGRYCRLGGHRESIGGEAGKCGDFPGGAGDGAYRGQ